MAVGYTDWFTLTHHLEITFNPVAAEKVQVTYNRVEDYFNVDDYSGPLSTWPTGVKALAYPFGNFVQGVSTYHADQQRGFHIGDGSPEDPDTLSPLIPSDPGSGASPCAWQWARHSRNNSQYWDGICGIDYVQTQAVPADLLPPFGAISTGILYYGHAYNPFAFTFGDVGWEWNACTFGLNFNPGFMGGEFVDNSLMPPLAIALEWDDTEPPVTFLDGSWSFATSGDYALRAYKRRGSSHDSGGATEDPNESGAPWWPGIDGTAPIPATEFASGSSFDAIDLELLTNGVSEVRDYATSTDLDLINNTLEFAFVPDPIVEDNWPGIDGVTTYFVGAGVDSMTFVFTFRTRPFRWSYRLPPTGGPGPIRRRWAIGKR